ncbi:MAG TPA: sigma-70 family RNA polymerase sigma factor [Planctomycetota bacterium]|nr:sigma-70 family RNA polymerase sigma factor [Planctomycetota bacterium]
MSSELTPPRVEELLAQAEWIRGFALRLARDEATADDLAQETLLAALERPGEARHGLRAWLAGVVRHLSFRRIREESARSRRERSTSRAEALPSHAEAVERADLRRMLVEVVLELDEPVRSILLRRFRDGRSPAQIASERGIPVGTVRSHLSRGLEAVRARLDERHGGDRHVWMEAVLSSLAPLDATRTVATWLPAAAAAAFVISAGVYGVVRAGASDAAIGAAGVLASAPPEGRAVAAAPASSSEAARRVASAHDRPPADSPAEAASAPFEGTVVDASTGEPVPSFALRVDGPSGGETLETDERGSFTTTRRFPSGRLVVGLRDLADRSDVRRVAHDQRCEDGRAPKATLSVPLGPTYPLAIALPAGLAASDLEALLLGNAAERSIHGRPYPELENERERVRDGSPPWVRFASDQMNLVGVGDPWTLVVASRDGLWRGEAKVPEIRGRCAPVAIELRPVGAVRGNVTGADGRRPDRTALHLAWPKEEIRAGVAGEITTEIENDGTYTFGALEPGQYTLWTYSPWYERVEVGVVVQAGATTRRDLVLPRRPTAGDIRGRARSRTGTFDRTVSIDLLAEKQPAGTFLARATVEWSGPPGDRIGHFLFEALPPGRYAVRPTRAGSMQLAWKPAEIAVEPGGPEVELECLDDVPAADLVVRALDATTGAEIPSFDVMTCFEGRPWKRRRNVEPGTALYEQVPNARKLHVSVRADGYRPFVGTEASFVEESPGRRVLEAFLERGWGARVAVLLEDSRPVVGATVVVDGVDAGTTDVDGTLGVLLPERPRSILAKRDGFEVVSGGAVDAKTGRFNDLDWLWLYVRMRPRGASGAK